LNDYILKMDKAIIKLGYGCNNECSFCHSRAKKKYGESSLDSIKRKIVLAKANGIGCILFSGGEPTLRKDIKDIIKYALDNGLKVGLITNSRLLGSLFDDDATGLEVVYTTLLGSRKEIHDSITCSASFEETLHGIRYCINNAIRCVVNIVIVKENMIDLDNAIRLLISIGVKEIRLSNVEPVSNDDMEHCPMLEDASAIVKQIIKKYPETRWDGFPKCLMKRFEKKVSNLKSENIKLISEVYEEGFFPSDHGNKEKIRICEGCAEKGDCEGIYSVYLKNRKVKLDPYIR